MRVESMLSGLSSIAEEAVFWHSGDLDTCSLKLRSVADRGATRAVNDPQLRVRVTDEEHL